MGKCPLALCNAIWVYYTFMALVLAKGSGLILRHQLGCQPKRNDLFGWNVLLLNLLKPHDVFLNRMCTFFFTIVTCVWIRCSENGLFSVIIST